VRVGFVEVGVEAGRFTNVLSKGVLDALNELQRERGLAIQGIASVPATYALGSLRIIPGVGPVRPFVSAGFGVARLSPRIDVVIDGISIGDVFGLTSFESRTEPLAAVGAGVRIGVGNLHVEGGYRYLMFFNDFKTLNLNTNSTLAHVNSVYAALGVRF
jgi:opacity protein-like surface antigen